MIVTFGGQFGSEGKGLLSSYLASSPLGGDYDVATTDAGPNAGHTAIMEDGTKVVTFHLPMGGVLKKNCAIYLNGGAIIDPLILTREVSDLDKQGFEVSRRLIIHPKAAVIRPNDVAAEKAYGSMATRASSTQKGVGTAAAHKILRDGIIVETGPHEVAKYAGRVPMDLKSTLIEVAQGFSLGHNTQFYPWTTHRACTPAQGIMNASLPTNVPHTVMAVVRVWPIRVGSLPGTTSGGAYPDQKETNWDALGLEPQYTTVTNRVRRVFNFSTEQLISMLTACNPDVILLNFCNHTTPDHVRDLDTIIKGCHAAYSALDVRKEPLRMLYGYGPKASDIKTEIQDE